MWRAGRSPSAIQTALCRLTEVLSQTATEPGSAPITGASLSPRRRGASSQSESFQPRRRRRRHSSPRRAIAFSAARGMAPMELASK